MPDGSGNASPVLRPSVGRGGHAASVDGLRQLRLRPSYSSGRDDLLKDFYVPALSQASSYDRIAGYFTSSALVSAAAGLARFVNGGGTMRMIVGAQLSHADCVALRGDTSLDEVLARRLATATLARGDVERQRLQVVAWLVREGRLEMRVGVPCGPDGQPLAVDHPDNDGRYFHLKSGILRDSLGHSVAFSGSINESSQGWSRNFEQFSVYMSWKPEAWADYGEPEVRRFERLWSNDSGPGWRIVALPEAFEQHLLRFVPDDYQPPGRDPAEAPEPEPVDPGPADRSSTPGDRAGPEPRQISGSLTLLSDADRKAIDEIRNAPATGTGVGLTSAAVEPWPHQLNIARRIVDTWPRSYLLADQVGLGKTIEVGLVLRELLLSRRIERALILVPASVLIQWQQELSEKFCLDVGRLDGADIVFGDRRRPIQTGTNPWAAEQVLLASSHLARRRAQRLNLLEAPGWDLVVLDEAHHARRRGSKPNDSPNQMLGLLRDLKQRGKFKALLLASATPMQMHPHELWDLLWLLGLPERWDRNSEAMQRYFEQLAEPFAERDWDFLRRMVNAHLAAAEPPTDRRTAAALGSTGAVAQHRIRSFADNGLHSPRSVATGEHPGWDEWLRACTPVRDRVFRTTRTTLNSYLNDGLLPDGTVIPERSIEDCFEDLGEAQNLYERIDDYIKARYRAYREQEDQRARALGFIMTVYRRRLTSSFDAIRCSLEHRRKVLERRDALAKLFDDDDRHAAEGTLQFDDLDEAEEQLAESASVGELDEIDSFIADLDALAPDEPKMRRLAVILEEAFKSGHRNAVIFTQYTDTLRYLRTRLLNTYRNKLACFYGGTGEIWDNEGECWVGVGKEHIKSQFRAGNVQILIGTDSMSEGLNLQTCAVMVNFDLPWNFTRVEQRIGRLDRIGGMPEIRVHNLYYRGTVEVDIYTRLRERFGSFEAVLGRSSPVLSVLEGAFVDTAMGVISAEQASLDVADSVKQAEDAAVRAEDLDAVPEPAGDFEPSMTLDGLRDRLLHVQAATEVLGADPNRPGVWLLRFGSASSEPESLVRTTFDRAVCAAHDDVSLLTWGSPLMDWLLDRVHPQTGPAT